MADIAAQEREAQLRKMERTIKEDDLAVVCWSCGNHYSLHMATVCPECFAWPKPPKRTGEIGPVQPPVPPRNRKVS